MLYSKVCCFGATRINSTIFICYNKSCTRRARYRCSSLHTLTHAHAHIGIYARCIRFIFSQHEPYTGSIRVRNENIYFTVLRQRLFEFATFLRCPPCASPLSLPPSLSPSILFFLFYLTLCFSLMFSDSRRRLILLEFIVRSKDVPMPWL